MRFNDGQFYPIYPEAVAEELLPGLSLKKILKNKILPFFQLLK
jgi:hypothetical protein